MKEIMKSLKDNAISRLKNPIVGAFALSWTILNINGLSLFLLGDTPTKIEIIKHKNWMLTDDFLIPLSIAIIYLIVLPLLNMVYELINDGLINFYRSKKKNDRDKKLAIQKKETVIAEIESDISYLQKLKDKDIDRWLEEKRKRNEEFIAQKALYSKLVGDSSNDQRTARNEIAKINKNNDELESQKSKLEKNQQEKKQL